MTLSGRHRRISALVEQSDETSFLEAVRRFPWTLAVFIPLFVFIGVRLESAAPESYSATTTLIVEDPRASTLFEITDLGRPSNQASERYLADQVAIIESTVAARIAASMVGDSTVSDVIGATTVTGDAVGNVIDIEAEASTPDDAKSLADALAFAYMEIRRDAIGDSADIALQEIDGLLQAVESDLADVNDRIESRLAEDDARQELRSQFDDAVSTLNSLRAQRDAADPASAERTQLNDQINELLRDFQVWAVVFQTQVADPDLQALLTEQDTLVTERANLIARRNSVTVGAELAAGGVTLLSPAELPTEPAGLTTFIVAAAMVVLGAVAAVSSAYWLSERSKLVKDRNLAENVLDAPLLAEIPKLSASTVAGGYPVHTTPASREARAFRLAASALDVRKTELESRSILVVSAVGRRLQSAIVANLAVAGAMNGTRTLVIDADIRDQWLTRHVFGDVDHGQGLVDVLSGEADLESVAGRIEIATAPDVKVLPLGRFSAESGALFRSNRSNAAFDKVVANQDIVLIDVPSLLDTPYAGTLARYADSLLVLLEEGVPVSDFEDLVERLDLISAPVIGYVYVHGASSSIVATNLERWKKLTATWRKGRADSDMPDDEDEAREGASIGLGAE